MGLARVKLQLLEVLAALGKRFGIARDLVIDALCLGLGRGELCLGLA